MATTQKKRQTDACSTDFLSKFAGVKNLGLLYTRNEKQSGYGWKYGKS